jgi:hypothetical protein
LQTPDTAYKESVGVPIADSGAWSIAAGTIVAAAGTSCDAKLVLRRFTAGDYPSSLRPGGFVEGQVQRAVAFISAP